MLLILYKKNILGAYMFKKLSLFLVIIALLAFIVGCETNLKQGSDEIGRAHV